MLWLVIFLHLAGAEAQLRTADLGHLSPAQRAQRARVIEQLAAYRERAVFPRNLDFDQLTPYFIDDRGVRCAMADLIEHNGGAALVAEVATTNNNAYVRELAADPRLRAWLDVHGLSVAEAARVQPNYPRETGQHCAIDGCTAVDGECVQPLNDNTPDGFICTIPCDPEGAVGCPVGMAEVAMTCQHTPVGFRCHYPGEVPFSTGAPCDPADTEGFQCGPGPCSAELRICLDECGDSCPEPGEHCVPWDEDPRRNVCRPIPPEGYDERGGCSTAPGASLLVGLAALFARRRRR